MGEPRGEKLRGSFLRERDFSRPEENVFLLSFLCVFLICNV